MSNKDLHDRFETFMMPNYATPEIALVSGDGCIVTDADGKTYLDLFAGIAVSSLGHAHPAVVDAVSTQVAEIAHTSNLYMNEPSLRLAERLVGLVNAPADVNVSARVMFTNSGTEANEAALKLAILAGKANGRRRIVAAENGFHGRTLGSLAVTGKNVIREPFEPFGLDVQFIPYGDVDAMLAAVTDDCAAVIMEPFLGEGGVVAPPPGYLAAVRQATSEAGALFIVDEVQCGIGRTGTWFAHQQQRIVPDIITVAKGLGGGLPIGAVIGIGDSGNLFTPGAHGSTFGGNPVVAAAALAVIDTIDTEGLAGRSVGLGHQIMSGIRALRHPLVAHTRGSGLLRGIVLTEDVAVEVARELQDAGFLVNPVRPNVIRIAPPLTITPEQIDLFIDALPDALDAVAAVGDES